MKRTPLNRKTPLRRKTAMPRSALAAARMTTGGSWARTTRKKLSDAAMKAIRPALRDRAGGACERCGTSIVHGFHAHHRKRRGGPELDVLSNLVALCATCHGWVHANPEAASRQGWIVPSSHHPAQVVVFFARGLVTLDDEGGVTPL